MKTAEERALEIVKHWRKGPNVSACQMDARLHVAITEALKEHDKLTRHACAEGACSVFCEYMRQGNTFPLGTLAAVDVAIMNVEAV